MLRQQDRTLGSRAAATEALASGQRIVVSMLVRLEQLRRTQQPISRLDALRRGPQRPAPFAIDLELRDGDLYIRPRASAPEASA